MKLAWNVQKNTVGSIKNLEREQNRDNMSNRNKLIDKSKSHLNYELVPGSRNLTTKTLELVEKSREKGSRIQKNSIVDLSNIITLSKEDAEKLGEVRTREYFESTVEFFQREFGTENVTSAIVHVDESSPHMHLHITPINLENGKLQARNVMTRGRVNKIHAELPKFLQERGFDVERGSSIEKDGTRKDYVRDINKLKQMTEQEREIFNELNQKNDVLEKTLKKNKTDIAEISKIKGDLERELSIDRETLEKEKEALKRTLEMKLEYEREMQNLFNQKMALSDELDELKDLVKDTKELAESVNTYKDGSYKIPLAKFKNDDVYRPLNIFQKFIDKQSNDPEFLNDLISKGNMKKIHDDIGHVYFDVKTGETVDKSFSRTVPVMFDYEKIDVEDVMDFPIGSEFRRQYHVEVLKDADRYKRFKSSEFVEEVKNTLEKNEELQDKFEKRIQKRNRSNDFER